ncbi:MAG: dephospho-CoA kinase [Phormidesmis priestleyi]|uniref:Dephospho-CoA kinase n=1 Tax=Phormidesmis priestleyi TaxID=268141 RepID=A0A2W4YU61_9CYAN|nr:MAG: dephospho-CoA kinase [Phormidesmis priestleyi]
MGTPVVNQRRIIGLTGGIATGKSTVSDYLTQRYGLPVLDADVYARAAVAKESKILRVIRDRYGSQILLSDGNLNRPRLGQIIFNDATEKTWIEQQIHPFVRTQFKTVAATFLPDQTLAYAIPLLFEANLTHLVTEIWVVTCGATQQKERLMARNQLSAIEAQSRIDAQMSLEEKCKRANYVIDNSASKEKSFAEVDNILRLSVP